MQNSLFGDDRKEEDDLIIKADRLYTSKEIKDLMFDTKPKNRFVKYDEGWHKYNESTSCRITFWTGTEEFGKHIKDPMIIRFNFLSSSGELLFPGLRFLTEDIWKQFKLGKQIRDKYLNKFVQSRRVEPWRLPHIKEIKDKKTGNIIEYRMNPNHVKR